MRALMAALLVAPLFSSAAFAKTRGDPDVVIAILSTGVRWDETDLVTRFALNRGELPPPRRADGSEKPASEGDPHDLNGDGRFDVRDYAGDPRLTGRDDGGDVNGNGLLDPQDLLRVFGDGVDDDGNGRIDDVCGWDFVDGDADASDGDAEEVRGSPGTRHALLAGAGVCPDCAILPLRVSRNDEQALRLSPSVLASSLRAAGELLASVAILPGATTQQTPAVKEVLDLDRLLLVAAAHPPSPAREPFAPHPAVMQVACSASEEAWTDALAPSPACTEEEDAAATAGGAAGLVHSALRPSPIAFSPEVLFHFLREGTLGGRIDVGRAIAAVDTGAPPHRFGAGPKTHRQRIAPHLPFDLSPWAPGADAYEVARTRTTQPEETAFHPLSGSTFIPERVPGTGTTFTVRARAEREGLVSELRFQLVAHARSLATKPPREDVGNTPRLVDVDGDGRDELVFATRDGLVHAVEERGMNIPGFPRALSTPGTIKAPIAAADLDGDQRRELIVATLEGSLHVLRGRGDGELFTATIEGGMQSAAVVASSYLGPLVIAVGDTGLLHVFRSNGAPLPGFPAQLPLAHVVHTPAAADLDGDELPELFLVGRTPDGRSQALRVGVDTGGPKAFGGWPIEVDFAGSPVLGDLAGSGRVQLAIPVRDGPPMIVDLVGLPAVEVAWAPEGDSPSTSELVLGDLRRDRRLWLAGAMGDATALWPAGSQLQRAPGRPAPVTAAPGAWPAGTGGAVADVSGDGRADLLHGADDALWAVTHDGSVVDGWPEPLGAALFGSPAVGMQNDGLVVAARTADNHLHLLRVTGRPEHIQWDGAHHDPGHTGYFGTRLPERIAPGLGVSLPAPEEETGCGCASNLPVGAHPFLFILLLGALARRVRRTAAGASP